MTNISTCCIDLIVSFVLLSAYNGTGCFLRISDFCSPNSELRVPISDFRVSERLDLQMFGLWFLDFYIDFQISRFLDFQISRFLNLP